MSKILLNCDEASSISDKHQYDEVSSWELLKLSFHNLWCKKCKVYAVQNNTITKVINSKSTDPNLVEKKLNTKEKEELQKIISDSL